jgi:serine/threonine-protein kinase
MNNSSRLRELGYQPLQVLTETTNSVVYRGTTTDSSGATTEVAIKAVPITSINKNTQEKQLDAAKVRQARIEGLVAQILASKNTVKVIEVVIDVLSGFAYLIMEYLPSNEFMPLNEYAQEDSLTFNQLVEVFSQIAEVVSQAAAKQILHQDIKPGNILVQKQADGSLLAKLADWGIANTQQKITRLAYSQIIDGTPAFIAPEKILQKEFIEIDVRSDIFAIGSSVFTILFGRSYFDLDQTKSRSVYEIKDKLVKFHQDYRQSFRDFITNQEYADLRQQGINDANLLAFFMKTLGPVEDRYSTPAECIAGLVNCQTTPTDQKITKLTPIEDHQPTLKMANHDTTKKLTKITIENEATTS